MEKMVVNKQLLSSYKLISIGLENCDVYEIAIQDVLDIYCEAELISNSVGYFVLDGFVKISSRASQTLEAFDLRKNRTDSEFYYRLKERLEMCNGGADVTSFSLKDESGKSLEFYPPYDPLQSALRGSELELSNCPSLEIDCDGNMVIAFGESSKQPRRKDNNYAELVDGWKDAFGENAPKVLSAKVKEIFKFGEDTTNYLISFKISKKFCKSGFAELVFWNCQNVNVEMNFPLKGDCDIHMSKMMDGRIYVGFQGLGMEFTCESVLEYDYYCNQI